MVTPSFAVVVALLAAQAPASPPELVPELGDCRVLVDAGRLADARACYERVAAVDPEQAAVARALADMLSPTTPTSPAPTTEAATTSPATSPASLASDEAPSSPLSLEALAWHGRGELIASAVLTGGAASLAVVGALPIDNYAERSMLSLAAPVLGGGVAGGVAAASVALLPSLHDGDVHLVRAGLWTGTFDAACVGVALSSNYVDTRTVAASMLLTWGAVSGATIAAAAIVDVDDAAPSLGLSFLWVGALSTGVGFGIADLEATGSSNMGPLIATTLGVVGTAAGIGGVIAGNALHLTRASIWLVDVGAGAGALSAYALATGLRAGTPALGWGTVLGGTLLGAGAGLVAAQRISDATDAGTSSPVSLAPSMLPVVVEGGRVDVVPGAVLSGSFR